MDVLHRRAGILHGLQRAAINVGRLDGVDLLLQRADLRLCLLQRALVRLFPSQRRLGRYTCPTFVSLVTSFFFRLLSRISDAALAGCHLRLTACVVSRHVLARSSVLVGNLILQVRLALLQHVKLRPQAQDRIFGRVFAVLRRTAAAEPAPHGYVGGGVVMIYVS